MCVCDMYINSINLYDDSPITKVYGFYILCQVAYKRIMYEQIYKSVVLIAQFFTLISKYYSTVNRSKPHTF